MPQPSPEEYARFAHETLKLKASKELEGLRVLFAQNEDILERCSALKAEAQEILQPQAGRDYCVLEQSIRGNLLSLKKIITELDSSDVDKAEKKRILAQATLFNEAQIRTLVQEARARPAEIQRRIYAENARIQREQDEAKARIQREQDEAKARIQAERDLKIIEDAEAKIKQRATLIDTVKSVAMFIGLCTFFLLIVEVSDYYHDSKRDAALQANGMWRDSDTNLIWMRCSLGQQWRNDTCEGTSNAYTWQQAQDAMAELNARQDGGFSDWRLPDIEELVTIRECSNGFSDDTIKIPTKQGGELETKRGCNEDSKSPTINQAIFPETALPYSSVTSNKNILPPVNSVFDSYWSASPSANYVSDAWYVDFGDGYSYNGYKAYNYLVRAVRAGQ